MHLAPRHARRLPRADARESERDARARLQRPTAPGARARGRLARAGLRVGAAQRDEDLGRGRRVPRARPRRPGHLQTPHGRRGRARALARALHAQRRQSLRPRLRRRRRSRLKDLKFKISNLRFVSAASLSLEAYAAAINSSFEGYPVEINFTAPMMSRRVRFEQQDLEASLIALEG